MIAGIGVDIVEHERIERIYERYQDRFAEKILSDEEMDDYRESAERERETKREGERLTWKEPAMHGADQNE